MKICSAKRHDREAPPIHPPAVIEWFDPLVGWRPICRDCHSLVGRTREASRARLAADPLALAAFDTVPFTRPLEDN